MVENILYVDEDYSFHRTRTARPDPADFTMHAHDSCEIYLFFAGRGTFWVEGNPYPLTPGDLLIMRPHEAHYIEIDPACPYERLALNFRPERIDSFGVNRSLLTPFFDREAGKDNRFSKDDLRADMIGLITEALTEPTKDRRTRIVSFLLPLLGEIVRACDCRPRGDTASSLSARLVRYLNDHLAEPITLERLSEVFFISKPQLCRVFKSATGSTVRDYLTVKRLLGARERIAAGESPLAVSTSCGYGDYSAFYRAFRHRFGCAPGAVKPKN